MAELRDSTWAHFACHAQIRLDDTSNSHLLLHDHPRNPLSVRHLAALCLPHAELAFLSACGTSLSSPGLMDEAVHITAAFQLAGFAHVIGPLWTINDRAAVRTAREIYTRLLATPRTDIAWAVHGAVHSMRDRYRELPSLWATHVHVGM
ncbi:CHAT domain-containing protein [Streptomyces sp. NPDC100445]|uniref:CHAT domain-containing protein n=1 Tax=Streptomyces sp. NPDC100445 TaxID=3366102 RepID=UPI0037F522C5